MLVGNISWAPGTWGSLLSLPILFFLAKSDLLFISVNLFIFTIALYAVEYIEKNESLHDPSWIVIDEYLGLAVAWFICKPYSLLDIFTLFILFRLFDIFKPGPISFIDKNVKHSFGTIADDLVAGVFAAQIYLLIKFFSYLLLY